MGIPLSSSFTQNAALPLDDRNVVANTAERDALLTGRRWEGMIVYVVAAQTNYQLVGGIGNENWVELSGSGGGGASSVYTNLFSGDGTTVSFTLSTIPSNKNNTWVYVHGVYQQKSTYELNGDVITFSEAPPVGANNIEIIVGVAAASSATAFYFGDENVNGTWRFYVDGPNLKVQVRIADVWETRDTYTP